MTMFRHAQAKSSDVSEFRHASCGQRAACFGHCLRTRLGGGFGRPTSSICMFHALLEIFHLEVENEICPLMVPEAGT